MGGAVRKLMEKPEVKEKSLLPESHPPRAKLSAEPFKLMPWPWSSLIQLPKILAVLASKALRSKVVV